jgi:tripartite-type tricarboxylate transporter receptor subunit TctC
MHLAAAAAAYLAASRFAWAQAYPSRPVRLIVGFPPGTAPDILARLVGQWLSERLGQQFIVENRPGASSNVATEFVAKAAPDGYTLLMAVSSNAVNAVIYTNLNFDFARDITPVAYFAGNPFVMVVTPSLPAKSFPEFIAYAKANPGKINMASQGVGTTPHVCGEMLKLMTGIEFTHVPYRGPLMPDLLAGQVHFYFSPMPQPIEYVRDGRLRALGVTTATRSDVLPDIPAIGEFVPGYEASGWLGLGTPKGTPAEIIDKLNHVVNAIVADPGIKTHLASLGERPMPMTPAEFGKFIDREIGKWGKVIKFAGIQPE